MTTTDQESTWQPAHPDRGRGSNNSSSNGNSNPQEGPNAGPRAPARARDAGDGRRTWAALVAPLRGRASAPTEAGSEPLGAPGDRAGRFWLARPESPAELVDYHRAACRDSWSRGAWLEFVLDLVFALFAVPVSVALYWLLFVMLKKGRFGVLVGVVVLIEFVRFVSSAMGG